MLGRVDGGVAMVGESGFESSASGGAGCEAIDNDGRGECEGDGPETAFPFCCGTPTLDPTSLFHASKPPNIRTGTCFNIFLNSVSYIAFHRTESGDFELRAPRVVESLS